MTVSTEIDHNEYTGNGATTSFPYTFRIMKNSDLVVQVVDLNENITQLLLDTDYSVTGAKGYSGGSVVLNTPLANGWQISINRSLPVTQETDLRNQGKFFAEVHEDAFDKLTMLIQQCFSRLRLSLRRPSFIANYYDALGYYIRNLRDPSRAQDAATKNYVDVLAQNNFNRSLRVPEGYVAALPSVDQRKNKIIAMDYKGDPLMVLPESGSAADVMIELAKPTGAGYIGFNDALTYPDGTLGKEVARLFRYKLYASKFGAVSGQNISIALQALSAKARQLKSNFDIIIDVGEAEIFDQTINPSPSSDKPYYIPVGGNGNLIELTDCSDFTIDFNGSFLKTKSGLRFGSFDPLTGQAFTTQKTGEANAAHIGRVVYLTRCQRYEVIRPYVDGNNSAHIIGGGWGDKDIQCTHTGMSENDVKVGKTKNPVFNNFGLDGMYIGSPSGQGGTSGIIHDNPVCQYNGRQGLSLTGGDHIILNNPDYSFTGRGAIYSAPGAGIDIEPNGNYWPVGVEINNPRIINPMGAGVLLINVKALQVNGGEIVSDGAAFYCAENPSEMIMRGTNIYGAIRIAKGRLLIFEDILITDSERYGIVPAATAPLIENLGDNVYFRGTSKIFSKVSGVSDLTKINTSGGNFDGVIFTFRGDKPEARTRAAYLRPNKARNISFIQEYTDSSNVSPDGEHTYVDIGNPVDQNIWQGDSFVKGNGLAISSRSGAINSLISTVKPNGIYNSGTSTAVLIVNGDGTVDIPIGVGFRRIGITLSSFANVRILVEQCSQSSSAASRHQSKLIASILDGLAGTVTVSIVTVNGSDMVRISGTTSDLSAVTATITSDKFVYDGVPFPVS